MEMSSVFSLPVCFHLVAYLVGTVVSKKQFTVCDYLLTRMLWQKMLRKYPKKSAKWVKEQHWRTMKGNSWTFATSDDVTRHTLRWLMSGYMSGIGLVSKKNSSAPLNSIPDMRLLTTGIQST